MRCFYAPETEGHDPQFRLTHGTVVRNAERAERAKLLLEGLSRLDLTAETPPEAPRAAYEAVHTPEFVRFLETGWEEWQKLPNAGPEVVPNVFPRGEVTTYPETIIARAGWHMSDTSAPIGAKSWEATRRSADCAVAAANAVIDGAPAAYALCRPPGHHTTADVAGGHCLMNVTAIAAQQLRTAHEHVAVLDIDVHHGNGTQAIFYDRADVLMVSVHAETHDYYPFYTGYAHETGAGAGQGFNLNLPLPRSTTSEAWLAAVDQGLERIKAYAPGALVLSLGLDAHENDPLDGMKVSFDGFAEAGRRIAAAGLPTVIVQEGGYLSPDLPTSLAAFMGGFLGKDPRAA
ncbi:acetylpolyamine aminohydrolase [Salipiger sp. CCB-MM3]|uniref:histone deacetylase family protein n=1 Tax=Salipiger sp. CCB-MM3 TaxID=1792508 RepID=UPI00080A9718|nr:histone deacetylase family protein [Salipiger sp. CCB-MM3]ANT61174.1 acetylpolyamine aminohydrolase [Salipiger sp. CCB-MM3]